MKEEDKKENRKKEKERKERKNSYRVLIQREKRDAQREMLMLKMKARREKGSDSVM